MAEPERKPLDPGFVRRVAQGVKYAISGVGPSDWFGPMQPMEPVAQEQAQGRQFDYMSGYNIQIQPRASEPVSFAQLRGLADGYDLLRLVIETRKDQVERLPWTVRIKGEDGKTDARCDEIIAKLNRPDGRLTWRQWLRGAIEDLLVLDAPSVYVRRNNGGKLFGLELIDGATIAPKIDDTGRIPLDGVAYQQVIKGVPAVDYTVDELVYYPRNVRTNKVYGYSPVEQIITTVNIALRRQIAQMQYFTEGNLPETLISVPKEWSVDQIKQFEQHFNTLLQGHLSYKRKGIFVPDGTKPYQLKDSPLKDEFDDWLARVVCYAFSVSPQGLVQMQNRSTAQVGAAEAAKEGLEPLKLWVQDFINECIIRAWGYTDLEFVWAEEQAIDPLIQAQINKIYADARILTRNEIRADLGRDPIEGLDDQPTMQEQAAQSRSGGDTNNENEQGVGKSAAVPFLLKAIDAVEDDQAEAKEEAPAQDSLIEGMSDQQLALASALVLIARPHVVQVTVWSVGHPIIGIENDQMLDAWAKAYVERQMQFVNQTTRAKIRDVMANAQGASKDTIVKKLNDIFTEAREVRANNIGQTWATATYGFASLYAMRKAGISHAMWVTTLDGRERATHHAMAGQVQTVGGFFVSPSGDFAAHPGGFQTIAENINCRCQLHPVKVKKSDNAMDWDAQEARRAEAALIVADAMRRMFDAQEAAVIAEFERQE